MTDQGQQGWEPRSRSGEAPQFGADRKRGRKGCGLGCLGAAVLLAVIGIVAAVSSSSSTPGTTASASHTQTPAASTTASGSADTSYTDIPLNPQPTSAAPAAKQVVLSFKGNGIKNSKTFAVGSADYSVAYTYNCASFGDSGNFIAEVDQSGNDLFSDPVANLIGDKGHDITYLHDGPAADLYISVNSECSWTVTVTDGDNG